MRERDRERLVGGRAGGLADTHRDKQRLRRQRKIGSEREGERTRKKETEGN